MSRRSSALHNDASAMGRRNRANPYGLYGALFGGLAIALFVVLMWWHAPFGRPVDWLVAINLTAMLAFFYDKLISGRCFPRVPESVLLGLALVGGSPGALLVMRLARHKTAKRTFLVRVAAVVVLQVGLIAAYVLFLR